ncbi:hypothetical protein NQ315_004215 [Exocentrus adspersus]|uniref:Zinc finger C2H2 LYAR-type domain-containing protein n=1 Tax=Exocentrus adspersus TaxID=1586481 RepID=A0AAV8W6S4_9CUCU|nr:hypothetical protein NQ315_004215 [Exocentrus adspersus]
MVVFTCTHCGDSLQKPKVEKHYSFVCKTVKSLTCVDCLKDFRGEEYATHTKCVTEDERYAAKGTYTNGIVKKGEVKQESWMEMIKSILDSDQNLNPPCRNLLNTISSYSNVPRKKHKFINFIKSSSGGRMNMNVIEDVWNIIEKYKNDKLKNDRNEKTDPEKSQNGSNGISEKEKNSKTEENEVKKRKADEETGDVPKKKKHKNVTEQSAKEVTEESPNTIQNDEDTPKKKKHRTKKRSRK